MFELVVEDCYDGDLNWGIFYYVDYGNGMDCYVVGLILGGGIVVLFFDSIIVYFYCYKDCEILDNGLFWFIVKLVYNLLVVKGDLSVIEMCIIFLDKGL